MAFWSIHLLGQFLFVPVRKSRLFVFRVEPPIFPPLYEKLLTCRLRVKKANVDRKKANVNEPSLI